MTFRTFTQRTAIAFSLILVATSVLAPGAMIFPFEVEFDAAGIIDSAH